MITTTIGLLSTFSRTALKINMVNFPNEIDEVSRYCELPTSGREREKVIKDLQKMFVKKCERYTAKKGWTLSVKEQRTMTAELRRQIGPKFYE